MYLDDSLADVMVSMGLLAQLLHPLFHVPANLVNALLSTENY